MKRTGCRRYFNLLRPTRRWTSAGGPGAHTGYGEREAAPDAWMRTSARLPGRCRGAPGVPAFRSDMGLIGMVTFPHVRPPAGFQLASQDHACRVHARCGWNEVDLFDLHSPRAGGARGFARGGYARNGRGRDHGPGRLFRTEVCRLTRCRAPCSRTWSPGRADGGLVADRHRPGFCLRTGAGAGAALLRRRAADLSARSA